MIIAINIHLPSLIVHQHHSPMSSVNSQSPMVGLSPRLPWSPPCLPRVECCRDFWLTTNKFVSMYKIFSGETLLFWQLWGVKFKQEVMIILVLVVDMYVKILGRADIKKILNFSRHKQSFCTIAWKCLLFNWIYLVARYRVDIKRAHFETNFFLQKSIKRISSESSITRRLSCLDSFVGHKRQLMEQETKQKPGGESCWW